MNSKILIFKYFWNLCLLGGLLVGTGGCAHLGKGLRIDNLDRPLNELQHAVVVSLPLGQRKALSGGMEFHSRYFATKGRKFLPAETAPVRYYAQVYILGDRRPYSIEIFVRRERRSSPRGNDYVADDSDQQLARVIQARIQQQLSKRREDTNIIDDFRIF